MSFLYISHQAEGLAAWSFKHEVHAVNAFLVDVLDTSGELGVTVEHSNNELVEAARSDTGYSWDRMDNNITMYLREVHADTKE